MAIYYFGYGSNMSADMMGEWCPDHHLLGAACLPNWQLVFTRLSQRWGAGVADIIPKADATVWGALYQVSASELSALDKKESNGRYYQRIDCVAFIDETPYQAFTYTVIDKAPHPIPTSLAYRDTMLTGARELNLPTAYINHIASLPVQD